MQQLSHNKIYSYSCIFHHQCVMCQKEVAYHLGIRLSRLIDFSFIFHLTNPASALCCRPVCLNPFRPRPCRLDPRCPGPYHLQRSSEACCEPARYPPRYLPPPPAQLPPLCTCVRTCHVKHVSTHKHMSSVRTGTPEHGLDQREGSNHILLSIACLTLERWASGARRQGTRQGAW